LKQQRAKEIFEESTQHIPELEMQGAQKESTSPSLLLNKMPSEILILIFEKLSVCSATCFGLTCHSVHDIWMKHIYRGPISLDELEESTVELTIMSTNRVNRGPVFLHNTFLKTVEKKNDISTNPYAALDAEAAERFTALGMEHDLDTEVSRKGQELEEDISDARSVVATKHTCLGFLLSNWRGIGPSFRLWQPDITFFALHSEVSLPAWHFVPKETYGELPVQKRAAGLRWRDFSLDSKIFLRYQDYHLMHIADAFYLPNPRNMSGEEWELKAIDAIDQDRERHDNQSEWVKFWEKTCFWRWESTKIMHKDMERRAASVAKLVDQEKRKGRGWLRRVEAMRRQ
jgi:hypothetical protein